MTLISLEHISKSFADKTVLNDISVELHRGDRVGLIGANGCGKSTLVKVILSELDCDAGQVNVQKGLSIGHLPQTLTDKYSGTIEQMLTAATAEIVQLEQQMNEFTILMATAEGADLEQILERYSDASSAFEARDGYNLQTRTDSVLGGLGLAQISRDRRVESLSGGEKTRFGLALLLIGQPEFLILDEPTNHLDFTMLRWLESYLSAYVGTVLVISHDREFLNQTVSRILEIDDHTHNLKRYSGNYSAYSEQKAAERARQASLYAAQQDEVRVLQQRIREAAKGVGHNRPMKDKNKMAYNGHGASVERQVSRNIHAAEAQLERILANPVPRPPDPLVFQPSLDGSKVHHAIAVSVRDVCVLGNAGQPILQDVSFTLGRQEKALVVGPNGAGKSTLLGVIAGVVQAAGGEVFVPAHAQIGFLTQEPRFDDAPDDTVLHYFARGLPGERDEHIARLLSYQLFRFEEFGLCVLELSPGQARKLCLARMMELRPALLLIDEPSNHISFDVLESLEAALAAYDGPMLVVSHDRWFIERFQGTRYTLAHGRLVTETKAAVTADEEARMRAEIEQISAYGVDGKGKRL